MYFYINYFSTSIITSIINISISNITTTNGNTTGLCTIQNSRVTAKIGNKRSLISDRIK